MDGSAWQVLRGLQAWQITQIPRRPRAQRDSATNGIWPTWARRSGFRRWYRRSIAALRLRSAGSASIQAGRSGCWPPGQP